MASKKKEKVKARVQTRGEWKSVKLDHWDDNEEFGDLAGLEVLEDYDIFTTSKKKKTLKKKTRTSKSDHNALAVPDIIDEGDTNNERVKKRKKSKKKKLSNSDSNDCSSPDVVERLLTKSKLKNKKNISRSSTEEITTSKPETQNIKAKHLTKNLKDNAVDPSVKRKAKQITKAKPEKKKAKESQIGMTRNSSKDNQECDMASWKDLFVPAPVLEALREQGFSSPTHIQALALPSAIRDRMDIVGAAETGSGKTLAFGIPIIQRILSQNSTRLNSRNKFTGNDTTSGKADSQKMAALPNEAEDQQSVLQEDSGNESEEMEDLPALEVDGLGCVGFTKDIDCEVEPRGKPIPIPDVTGLDAMLQQPKAPSRHSPRKMQALILTPTRELAVQVKNHLTIAARHTDIKVAAVIGGISLEKQARLLRQEPEIVVATPGRLWELHRQGTAYLSTMKDIQFLVVDEADRMIEKGHFAELASILELINENEEAKKQRQTFVFSATLTLIHLGPNRVMKKKKKPLTDVTQKLEHLVRQIGIKEKHKVIDLSTKTGTAERIHETRINCSLAEKDMYMYYFLLKYPGRTLVFANSISCIRRLAPIFTLLQRSVKALHGSMQQRQRLKNLEAFQKDENGLLMATDVAARGLDIPNVKHVIHYQVAKTSESYIHRSGRTARAAQEGVSVTLICPDEVQYYRRLCRTLNRVEDLPAFPIDRQYLPAIKERLQMALELDKLEHGLRKETSRVEWFQKAAEEMDIDLDEDLIRHGSDYGQEARVRKQIKAAHRQLAAMLRTPVFPRQYSMAYPTMAGSLQLPRLTGTSALSVVKEEREKHIELKRNLKASSDKRKRKFKNFTKRKKQKKDALNSGAEPGEDGIN
ncbi:PREDICTED: ATP-dependent RNA helicase DDX24-like [Priapulus caudatus]|uniref:RNA helicase n=1 Tax=Priapulus caudatus TaxID=37621 RepID=A0ABM1EX39_PRICU|nr:PREDICTED: ATP-dependent RNA helicase DDX24-like [Priapulus caudatus]